MAGLSSRLQKNVNKALFIELLSQGCLYKAKLLQYRYL